MRAPETDAEKAARYDAIHESTVPLLDYMRGPDFPEGMGRAAQGKMLGEVVVFALRNRRWKPAFRISSSVGS